MIRVLKAIARRLFYWVWGEELGGVRSASTQAVGHAAAAVNEVRKLKSQLAALLAIDVHIKGSGKAIILTRVKGQDRCKIIDIAPELTIEGYRSLVQNIESTYGVQAQWIDTPPGFRDFFVMERGR